MTPREQGVFWIWSWTPATPDLAKEITGAVKIDPETVALAETDLPGFKRRLDAELRDFRDALIRAAEQDATHRDLTQRREAK